MSANIDQYMKTVDVRDYTIVKAGVPCQSETPIRLERLVALMERNESYIYWLQPAAGGVEQQFPSVCINDKFYTLNLKLEKAIFRHVRLCRDFNNCEMLEDGTKKLRIPCRLLKDKLKTSCRFQVSAGVASGVTCIAVHVLLFNAYVLTQRMPSGATIRKPKRTPSRFKTKDRTLDKTQTEHLHQFHAHVREAHARAESTTSTTCLLQSPRACLDRLRRVFLDEFPEYTHRVKIELTA
mgnify:CR=1 FL=1